MAGSNSLWLFVPSAPICTSTLHAHRLQQLGKRSSVPVPKFRKQRSCTVQALIPTGEMVSAVLGNSTMILNTTSPALELGKVIAGPGINIFNFVMIVRIILTWYPQTDLAKVPWIFIAVPTEPLLRATRKIVPPVGGVDISPIVWFAIMSFVHEILVGPQGLLVLMSQK